MFVQNFDEIEIYNNLTLKQCIFIYLKLACTFSAMYRSTFLNVKFSLQIINESTRLNLKYRLYKKLNLHILMLITFHCN